MKLPKIQTKFWKVQNNDKWASRFNKIVFLMGVYAIANIIAYFLDEDWIMLCVNMLPLVLFIIVNKSFNKYLEEVGSDGFNKI